MSSKKKLKAKNKRLKDALKMLDIEMRLLRSDLLVDNQRLSHRVVFAESQVKTLIGDNMRLQKKLSDRERKDVGNREETLPLPEVPCHVAPPQRVAEHDGNPENNTSTG